MFLFKFYCISTTQHCANSYNEQFIHLFSQHVTAPAMASVIAAWTVMAAVSVKRGGRVNTANQKSVRAGLTWKALSNVLDLQNICVVLQQIFQTCSVVKTLSFACYLTEVKPICSPACDLNAVCLPENNCECVPPYGGNGINCTGMNCDCCIRLIVRCLSWIQMAYIFIY